MDAGSKGAVWCRVVDCLAIVFGLFHPLAGYRVYNVEDAQLVGAGCFLEVGVNLLDQN